MTFSQYISKNPHCDNSLTLTTEMSSDIFESLKYLLFISKICGTLPFRIKGSVGYRIFKINKLMPIYLITFGILYTYTYSKIIINNYSPSEIKISDIPILIQLINNYILIISIIIWQIMYRKKYLGVYKIIHEMLIIKRISVNYGEIKKFSCLALLAYFTFLISIFIIDPQFGLVGFVFYFSQLSNATTIVQFWSLLFIIKCIICEVNNNIKSGRIQLEVAFNIHFICYKTCKVINYLYFYLIFSIFITTFTLTYVAFKFSTSLDFNFVYITIVWNMYDFMGLFLFTSICEVTKREVSFIYKFYWCDVDKETGFRSLTVCIFSICTTKTKLSPFLFFFS